MMPLLRLLAYVVRLTVRTDRRAAALLCALTLAQSVVVAATALSQRYLIDASGSGHAAGVAGSIAVAAVALGVSNTAARQQTAITLYLVGRVQTRLNGEIQCRVAEIPTVTHVEHGPYIDRWGRLFGNSRAIAALPWSALDAACTTIGLATTVILLVAISPLLSLLVALAMPLLLAHRRADVLLRRARDATTELVRQEQRLHDLCIQPEPAKEVILSGSGPEVSRRAGELWAAAARRETRARLHALIYQVLGWLAYAAGMTATIIIVGRLVSEDRTTLGAAVMVVTLATQLQAQFRTMLESFSTVAEAGQVIEHYWWLRHYHDDAVRPGDAPPADLGDGISLEGVGFRYPAADDDVLHDVTLRFPAGSTVAVVGPNGAGKSTLIKLLTGVYEPTAGRIMVAGRPLTDLDRGRWQAACSGLHQDFARLRLRAGETVGVGDVTHVRDRAVIQAALDRADARTIVEGMPQGLDSRLGADFGGVEPSLGEWQRLGLARSLMRTAAGRPAPACVVLDEPTAALDPLAEHDLFRHFLAQARAASGNGAVTVLVSHRFTTVRLADVIVVLDDGRVAELGPHDELMAACGRYAELYRLQERVYR
ncbi:ABC transporter ATP-binding protein [Actinoplanes sp. NPDC026619]|uniref:ABC transporter ATP-binding protein n=1 Tax=Actinoplanes sp. NPDC026619 TaxID=3155798 RepID=UPI00340E0699